MNRNSAAARNFDVTGNVMSSEENEYSQFCDYLESTCGITLGTNKSYLVESRLKLILQQYGIARLAELVKMLDQGTHRTLERQVIDAMTTNETSWFRDTYPFDFLRNDILPAIPMSHKRPFRIWSAACSYGHEPYSISMTVQEFLEKNPGRITGGVEIMGTDISSRALEQSQSGIYKNFDTERGLSEERKNKYFEKKTDGCHIRDYIKTRVSFRQHNLITNAYPLGMFDIIFCRNVLIYFSNDNKKQILKNMVKTLTPDGYLFLGASEPMVNYSDRFNMVSCKRGVLYQLKHGKFIW